MGSFSRTAADNRAANCSEHSDWFPERSELCNIPTAKRDGTAHELKGICHSIFCYSVPCNVNEILIYDGITNTDDF